jgi:glycosyltransferase involved in cell wall biosynthesis
MPEVRVRAPGDLVRIVLPVLRYLPALGGATRLVQLIAEGAAAQGHSVAVVTQAEPGAADEEVIAGVHVIRLGMRHVAGFRIPKGYLRRLRSLDADLLHQTGNRIWNVDYYLPFTRSFHWPQVIMPLGFYHYWMRPGWVRWAYYDQYFARRIRAFDAYVALTEGERDQVLGWKYPPDRIHLIPVGIDLNELRTTPEITGSLRSQWGLGTPRVAVYVGGCYDNKRVDRLIRAIAATHGKWGLVVVGPDVPGTAYDRAHCEALSRQLSAPVRFLGPVSRSMVIATLHASDAYVQGSAFEGFGIGLLEGMAAGKPFVAFDAGAARELSARGGGICVTSEEEMSRALLELPEHSDEMARAAQATAADFSVERMVGSILGLYRSLVRADR